MHKLSTILLPHWHLGFFAGDTLVPHNNMFRYNLPCWIVLQLDSSISLHTGILLCEYGLVCGSRRSSLLCWFLLPR